MEINAAGYYVIPRMIKGVDFVDHVKATLDCGNLMYVQFSVKEVPVRVFECVRAHNTGFENSVYFTVSDRPRGDVLIEDISEFNFLQFRPNTEWVAIHMGKTHRINLEQFEELYISDTFRHLHPVIFNHASQFWHVMGLELAGEEDARWYIYLKRQDSDFMTRIAMPSNQKFIYHGLSNSWALDDPTEEITDHEKIKEVLRKEGVWEVTVSGVPMKLIRVMNIASDVLFFVFKDENDANRYYYARPGTKLRIVTDAETLEMKYLLDHVKAIHID